MPQQRKWKNDAQRQAAYRSRKRIAYIGQRQTNGLPAAPHIPPVPGWPRWLKMMTYAEAVLIMIDEEMDGYHDDRTDRWRDGDKGYEFMQKYDALRAIMDEIAAWPE